MKALAGITFAFMLGAFTAHCVDGVWSHPGQPVHPFPRHFTFVAPDDRRLRTSPTPQPTWVPGVPKMHCWRQSSGTSGETALFSWNGSVSFSCEKKSGETLERGKRGRPKKAIKVE